MRILHFNNPERTAYWHLLIYFHAYFSIIIKYILAINIKYDTHVSEIAWLKSIDIDNAAGGPYGQVTIMMTDAWTCWIVQLSVHCWPGI